MGLTRSAHDLGVAFLGSGAISPGVAEGVDSSPVPLENAAAVAFARFSPLGGWTDLAVSEATLAVVFLVVREGKGILGTAGRMGIEGIANEADVEALGVVCCGGAADDGVVG